MNWDRKWLGFNFKSGSNAVSNSSATHVKMNGSVIDKKSSFDILILLFPSKLDWGSYIFYIP